MSQFYVFVDKNFVMPTKTDLKGKIYTQFIVEADGRLSNLEIIKDLGYESGAEALRVLQKSPNWNAGLKDGKAVRTRYLLPLIINDWR